MCHFSYHNLYAYANVYQKIWFSLFWEVLTRFSFKEKNKTKHKNSIKKIKKNKNGSVAQGKITIITPRRLQKTINGIVLKNYNVLAYLFFTRGM